MTVGSLSPAAEETIRLVGDVIDADTGQSIPSRVYIQDSKGEWLFPKSADPAGTAVVYSKTNWVNPRSVEMHTTLSAHPFEIELPPGAYQVTAERGKEYSTVRYSVDLEDRPQKVMIPMRRWIDMAALGWYSGDTHVHRTVEELPNVLLAEDLNVAFPLVYWVTRSGTPPSAGDKNSQVPDKPLIEVDSTHVISTRNTEYEIFTVGDQRHTLGAFFALHHGPEFEAGVPPVRPIAAEAHRNGALLDLDKHDWPWSIALVPVMGIDLFELSNNHVWRTEFAFTKWTTQAAPYMGLPDEGRSGGELDWILYGLQTYYALLDCDFRLRPTAGTASGVHPVPLGFSRVYVHVDGDFTFQKWFRGLREGRSFVTTGPMLIATANGKLPGEIFRVADGETQTVELDLQVLSDAPVETIEIVSNGQVVRSVKPENTTVARGTVRTGRKEAVTLKESGWTAVRCFQKLPGGRTRFAHTAPFWVEVGGRPIRPRRQEVQFLLRRVEDEIRRSAGTVPEPGIGEYKDALGVFERLLESAREDS